MELRQRYLHKLRFLKQQAAAELGKVVAKETGPTVDEVEEALSDCVKERLDLAKVIEGRRAVKALETQLASAASILQSVEAHNAAPAHDKMAAKEREAVLARLEGPIRAAVAEFEQQEAALKRLRKDASDAFEKVMHPEDLNIALIDFMQMSGFVEDNLLRHTRGLCKAFEAHESGPKVHEENCPKALAEYVGAVPRLQQRIHERLKAALDTYDATLADAQGDTKKAKLAFGQSLLLSFSSKGMSIGELDPKGTSAKRPFPEAAGEDHSQRAAKQARKGPVDTAGAIAKAIQAISVIQGPSEDTDGSAGGNEHEDDDDDSGDAEMVVDVEPEQQDHKQKKAKKKSQAGTIVDNESVNAESRSEKRERKARMSGDFKTSGTRSKEGKKKSKEQKSSKEKTKRKATGKEVKRKPRSDVTEEERYESDFDGSYRTDSDADFKNHNEELVDSFVEISWTEDGLKCDKLYVWKYVQEAPWHMVLLRKPNLSKKYVYHLRLDPMGAVHTCPLSGRNVTSMITPSSSFELINERPWDLEEEDNEEEAEEEDDEEEEDDDDGDEQSAEQSRKAAHRRRRHRSRRSSESVSSGDNSSNSRRRRDHETAGIGDKEKKHKKHKKHKRKKRKRDKKDKARPSSSASSASSASKHRSQPEVIDILDDDLEDEEIDVEPAHSGTQARAQAAQEEEEARRREIVEQRIRRRKEQMRQQLAERAGRLP